MYSQTLSNNDKKESLFYEQNKVSQLMFTNTGSDLMWSQIALLQNLLVMQSQFMFLILSLSFLIYKIILPTK
jgi:hypothetical protein